MVGTHQSWAFEQSEIRVGKGEACNIILSDPQFQTVSDNHFILYVEQDRLRLEDLRSAAGTFVNGRRVDKSEVPSDSVVQLGANGPSLRISFAAAQKPAPSIVAAAVGVAPTVVREAPNPPVQQPQPQQHSYQPAGQNPFQALPQTAHGDEAMLEHKIESLQKLLTVTVVLAAALLVVMIYLIQQVNATQQTLDAMHKEAATAVGKFMPELDARLSQFETKVAQVETAMGGVDNKIKQAEDRFVVRLDQDLPKILDRYVERKLQQLQTQNNKGR